MRCCWFDQNNTRIQLINLVSFTFLDSEHQATKLGHAGMMCVLFIYMLSTLSSDIFIGTVKQPIKFIPYLTAITNSSHMTRSRQISLNSQPACCTTGNRNRWGSVWVFSHFAPCQRKQGQQLREKSSKGVSGLLSPGLMVLSANFSFARCLSSLEWFQYLHVRAARTISTSLSSLETFFTRAVNTRSLPTIVCVFVSKVTSRS